MATLMDFHHQDLGIHGMPELAMAIRPACRFEAFLLQQVLQEDLQRQALRCGDEPSTVVLHQGPEL